MRLHLALVITDVGGPEGRQVDCRPSCVGLHHSRLWVMRVGWFPGKERGSRLRAQDPAERVWM